MPPMPPTRWYVPGSLAIGTAFDEVTDAPSPLSVNWANVGSAVRHEGGDTLNLLESGPAAVDKGPALNWWALNSGKRAVRLASLSARFVSTEDSRSSGYLTIATKSPTGDLNEALRITE